MNVNGVTKRWNRDVAEDTYNINYEFRLPSCEAPIDIRVGGWEKDPGGRSGGIFDWFEDNDDELSSFQATHSAPNTDRTIIRSYERRASNATGDYTLYYEILRTCKETKVVSKTSLLATMEAYGVALQKKRKGVELKAKSQEQLLNAALGRLRRAGWRVVAAAGDDLILEGFMPIGKRERLKEAGKVET